MKLSQVEQTPLTPDPSTPGPVAGVPQETVYKDGFEYVNDERVAFYHAEGRITYNTTIETAEGEVTRDVAEWNIVDHLGNTRLRYVDKNGDKTINLDSEDLAVHELTGSYHYYPFGMLMEGNFTEHQGVEEKYQYNGIEHTSTLGMSIGLTTYRVHDASLGSWWQVDPRAESLYSISPYNAMGNNPVTYSDPNGDFIPQLVGGVVGGAINVFNNWDKILTNPVSAFGYAATGIGAGVVATLPGGIAASRAILAGGNVATDIASGNIPQFNGVGDVLGYAGGTAIDAFTTAGASKAFGKIAQQSLSKVAIQAGKEIGTEGAMAGLGSIGESSLNVYGIATPMSSDLFLTAADGAVGITAQSINWGAQAAGHIGLGTMASTGLGIANSPQLPDKTIVNQNGVKVEHYYKSGDHGPAHAHVKGGGPETRIGQNGHPLKGNPELTSQQRKVIMEPKNRKSIRKSLKKIMKWYKKAR